MTAEEFGLLVGHCDNCGQAVDYCQCGCDVWPCRCCQSCTHRPVDDPTLHTDFHYKGADSE